MSGPIQNRFSTTTSRLPSESRVARKGKPGHVSVQRSALEISTLMSDDLSFVLGSFAAKKLRKRDARDDRTLRSAARKKADARSQELGSLVASEDLMALLDELSRTPPGDELRFCERIEQRLNDPSQQEAAYQFLQEFLDEQGIDDQVREVIGQRRSALQNQHGEQIRADYNVARDADSFQQQGLGSAQDLRGFYRSQVLDYRGPEDVLQHVEQQFGANRVESALEFLMQGLSAEMQSAAPSMSMEQLKSIVDDITAIQMTRNFQISLHEAAERTSAAFGWNHTPETRPLLDGILDLKSQRWIDAAQVDRMIGGMGPRNLNEQIYVARELREIVRELPDKMFREPEEGIRLNDAFQAALDRLVEKEDAL